MITFSGEWARRFFIASATVVSTIFVSLVYEKGQCRTGDQVGTLSQLATLE